MVRTDRSAAAKKIDCYDDAYLNDKHSRGDGHRVNDSRQVAFHRTTKIAAITSTPTIAIHKTVEIESCSHLGIGSACGSGGIIFRSANRSIQFCASKHIPLSSRIQMPPVINQTPRQILPSRPPIQAIAIHRRCVLATIENRRGGEYLLLSALSPIS